MRTVLFLSGAIVLSTLVSTGAALAAPRPAPAGAPAGVGVEPGLWEVSATLPDPSTGEMRPITQRECVRERIVTAERVKGRLRQCRIWNARFQTRSAKWSMRCDTPAGPISGSGSLQSNGTKIAGTLDLSYTIGGFEIPFSTPFQARRLGVCR